jgi:hypothetical protein
MNDSIVYAYDTDRIGILIPLVRRLYNIESTETGHYSFSISDEEPLAYLVDFGDDNIPVLDADSIKTAIREKILVIIGEL